MEFEEKLINAVESRPELYNMRHVNYKNNLVRMELWYQVSKETNNAIDVCQKRWKSIRHRYMEELKRRKLSSGSGALKRKKWHLFDMLHFLNKFVEERQSVSSHDSSCDPTELPATKVSEEIAVEYTENSMNEEQDMIILSPEPELVFSPGPGDSNDPQTPGSSRPYSGASSTSIKNKRRRVEQLIEEELSKPVYDDVEQFLLSLAPTIRKFDDVERLEVQMEFQNILLKKIK